MIWKRLLAYFEPKASILAFADATCVTFFPQVKFAEKVFNCQRSAGRAVLRDTPDSQVAIPSLFCNGGWSEMTGVLCM
jgi:hypothetical protein